MKTTTLLLSFLFLFHFHSNAQPIKIGMVDNDKIMNALPEFQMAQKEFKAFQKAIENQLNQVELYYQSQARCWNDSCIEYYKRKLEEYQNLSVKLPEILKKKEKELIVPVIQKLNLYVESVALENGYLYILDKSKTVTYKTDDLTALVIEKIKLDNQ